MQLNSSYYKGIVLNFIPKLLVAMYQGNPALIKYYYLTFT